MIAISISSIQRTAGASPSTVFRARWKLASGFAVPKTRFMSSRKRGRFQRAGIALTESDFPQPDIPIIRSPFGTGSPASTASLVKRCLPLPEPVLEVLEPADVVEREAGRDVLEDPRLPGGLLLLGEELVERRLVEPRGPGEDLREDVLQLVERLAPEDRDHPVGVDGREPPFAEVPLPEDGDRVPDLRLVRQVVVDEEDLLVQVLRQEEPRRDHHHELPLPLQLPVGVPELPDDVGPLRRGGQGGPSSGRSRARSPAGRRRGPAGGPACRPGRPASPVQPSTHVQTANGTGFS